MERFHRDNADEYRNSRGSSVYSTDSTMKTSSSDYADGTTNASSRPIPTTPSYMNAIPTRKPVNARPMSAATDLNGLHTTNEAAQQQSAPTLSLAKGMLLIAIADLPHASTISYLEMMLKRAAYSSIVILGQNDRETELKQLKMNAYALLGKLSIEAGVVVDLQSKWTEKDITDSVERGLRCSDVLHGVICTPAFDDGLVAGTDVLALAEADFETPWRGTVGFLRSTAKATVPNLKPNSKSRAASGLFVVTEPARLSQVGSIYKASCGKMLALLADQNLRLTVAYADTVLIPEPESLHSNDKLDLAAPNNLHNGDDDDFHGGESPTKLWNMWALQDELNIA